MLRTWLTAEYSPVAYHQYGCCDIIMGQTLNSGNVAPLCCRCALPCTAVDLHSNLLSLEVEQHFNPSGLGMFSFF